MEHIHIYLLDVIVWVFFITPGPLTIDLFENGFFGKSSQIYTNAILQSEVLIDEGSLLFNQYIEDGYKSTQDADLDFAKA